MKLHTHLFRAWLAAGLGFISQASGQSTPQLETDVRNVFSQQPASQWPPPRPSLDEDARTPTARQWQGGTAYGGWQTTRISVGGSVVAGSPDATEGPTTLILPMSHPVDGAGAPIAGEGVQLESSLLALPLVGRQPTYLFGDVIPRPLVDDNGAAVLETDYFPEPDNSPTSLNFATSGLTAGRFYYSPHAKAVFATQPGAVTVVWRFRQPHTPQTVTLNYIIGASAGRDAKRIFWTEKGFSGPLVTVPQGRINAVNVVYNGQFPSQVATQYASPYEVLPPASDVSLTGGGVTIGTGLPPEKRTLWYSALDRSIHAYNQEGRVFVEFLGTLKQDGITRDFLGSEVVDVIKEQPPQAVVLDIGTRLLPHSGSTDLVPWVISGSTGAQPFLYQHMVTAKQDIHYYGVRTTNQPASAPTQPTGEVVLYWLEKGGLQINWPSLFDTYVIQWPANRADYSTYVRANTASDAASDTAVRLDPGSNPFLAFQDDVTATQAGMTGDGVFSSSLGVADPNNRALIRYTSGDHIWFERVFSELNTQSAGFSDADAIDVDVGQRIEPPAGYESLVGHIRTQTGTAYNPAAYRDPFVDGFQAARAGAIIGVNALPSKDLLEVWWYKKSTPPAGTPFSATLWPVVAQKYQLHWPEDADDIVLAANRGTDDLPSEQAVGSIYFENDPAKTGYNPNEEHAIMLAGRGWALRDDLNLETTSKPYVLISYQANDGRPAMRPFRVMREDASRGWTFTYNAYAGTIIQAPMPLPVLPQPILPGSKDVANYELYKATPDAALGVNPPAHYGSFTYKDRKGSHWLYRGRHDGRDTSLLEMRYYYIVQTGFWFPGFSVSNPGADVGRVVPYLRTQNADGSYVGDPKSGEPLSIQFRPLWPVGAPELRLGETLTLPKRGLPAVRGNISAEILYQQSVALDQGRSAVLFDPTRAKMTFLSKDGLAAVPSSIKTSLYKGKTYFPNLPPHLSQRFFLDPSQGTNGALVLTGKFIDETLGDDYLQLNTLSEAEIAALKDLCSSSPADVRGKWNTAVDGLTTQIETFLEDSTKRGTYVSLDPNQAIIDAQWAWIDDPAQTAAKFGKFADTDADIKTFNDGVIAALGGTTDVRKLRPGFEWLLKNQLAIRDAKTTGIYGSEASVILNDGPWSLTRAGTTSSQALPASITADSAISAAGHTTLTRTFPLSALPKDPYITFKAHPSSRVIITLNDKIIFENKTTRKVKIQPPPGKGREPYRDETVTEDLSGSRFTPPKDAVQALSYQAKLTENQLKVGQNSIKIEIGQPTPSSASPMDVNLRLHGNVAFATADQTERKKKVKDAYEKDMADLLRTAGPRDLAEITNSDQAVDSYAISASGAGSGYVVLLTGGGKAFTPEGGPVALHVFKVAAPLYRGEMKVIAPTNPLDEKLTLQHVSDFAAKEEDFDFEWRTAPPVDGLPPSLYTYTRQLVMGDGTWTASRPRFTPGSFTLNGGTTLYSAAPAVTISGGGGATATAVMTDGLITGLNITNAGTGYTGTPAVTFSGGTVATAGTNPTATGIAAGPAALPAGVVIKTDSIVATEKSPLTLKRTFTLNSRPLRLFLSLDAGPHDQVTVNLNSAAAVVAYNVPGIANNTTVVAPLTSFISLPLLFEIPASALLLGENTLTLDLGTTGDTGSQSLINARLEGMTETENLTAWNLIGPTPSETAGLETGSVKGRNRYVIQGPGLFTLTDNYFVMRYRARAASHAANQPSVAWSRWTDPNLAEGWIKRVLKGINPFEQRVKDLFNSSVNTDVSVLTQAGKRWEGDIPLNLENINDFGLIEIYETVLRRGKSLSIEGTPAINYPPANDALLLAAGYLNDLYMVLGNEAFSDASNPTIAFSSDGIQAQYGDVATSLFAFKGQLATVLDEELCLLRGRDDFLQPGVKVTPIYNRLPWNFTSGINSGEAIYALNYNIKDLDRDGVAGAKDAAIAQPQGHGDAYGHYLTALTGYYSLLSSDYFSWTPRIEATSLLGKPVSVDYFDERKFATAAAALCRTAAQIADLTYRSAFDATGKRTWVSLKDGRTNPGTGTTRTWGVDDWATRGGQGAYFHWLTANSMLPAVDGDPDHEGIQKIDRTTVPELKEIVAQATSVQNTLDTADARLNPLGLSVGAVPFDISPTEVDAGQTHYEQIYGRAVEALRNSVTAFNNAKSSTQFLRRQDDSLVGQRDTINAQEKTYTNQLIDIYGTPYPGDMGPGKTYAQGYTGPDYTHFMYVDIPELFKNSAGDTTVYKLRTGTDFTKISFDAADWDKGTLDNGGVKPEEANFPSAGLGTELTYTLDGIGQFVKPAEITGQRVRPGKLQDAISDALAARLRLSNAVEDYSEFSFQLRKALQVFRAQLKAHKDTEDRLNSDHNAIKALEEAIASLENGAEVAMAVGDAVTHAADTAKEFFPKVIGFSNDVTSAGRGIVGVLSIVAKAVSVGVSTGLHNTSRKKQNDIEVKLRLQEIGLTNTAWTAENRALINELQNFFETLEDGTRSVDFALRGYDDATRKMRVLMAEGDRIQAERETFRQKASALIQGYRTKDFGFRTFRNEALESYKSLFDLAGRYTFLAARAYDYETGLADAAGSAKAADFFQKIVRARAVGVFADGRPQPAGSQLGDPGLSGVLAQMNGDWSVVKSRFGFNNPDRYRTTFSLRTEKERIINGSDGDVPWGDVLAAAATSNILEDDDVRRYCMQVNSAGALSVPGFVIPFQTTISSGYNFFGQPLAGGDSTFSPTSFATKIRSNGVAFTGYVGMASPSSLGGTLVGTGATTPPDPYTGFADQNALSSTPYVYLVPCGVDSMRAPALGDSSVVRSWTIEDQAIPMPFDVGGATALNSGDLVNSVFTIRKHQAFRAVPDGTVFSSSPGFLNSRLIGRSVWNSRWKLVIPGPTLLADPARGMDTFKRTVKDIKIHFETYSYSGN